MRACRLPETVYLALNLMLEALHARLPPEGRRSQGAPRPCISVHIPCSAGPKQAAAHAMQFAPLYDHASSCV